MLKVMSAAGASSALWTKPVVESVVLPAHAGMSSEVTATVELFSDSAFTMEIVGDPPEVEIGTPFYLLITTDSPNTTFYFATYAENGERNGAVESFTTDGDGRAALSANPPGPAGTTSFVIASTEGQLVFLLALVIIFIVSINFREVN